MELLVKSALIILVQTDGHAIGLGFGMQENRVEQRCGRMMDLKQVSSDAGSPGTPEQALGEGFERALCWLIHHTEPGCILLKWAAPEMGKNSA